MGYFSRSRNPFWSFIHSYRFAICTYLHIVYKVDRQIAAKITQHGAVIDDMSERRRKRDSKVKNKIFLTIKFP